MKMKKMLKKKLPQDRKVIIVMVVLIVAVFFIAVKLLFLPADVVEKEIPLLEATTTTLPAKLDVELKKEESIKIGENGYKLLMEKPENLYGRTITLIDVLARGSIVLDVDGKKESFAETNTLKLMDGLLITYVRASTGTQKSEKTAIVAIEELNLGEGEYFLNVGGIVTGFGKLVKLENVGPYGSITVKVGPKQVYIEPNDKGIVGAYTIRNLMTFYSDRRGERSALIKVEAY